MYMPMKEAENRIYEVFPGAGVVVIHHPEEGIALLVSSGNQDEGAIIIEFPIGEIILGNLLSHGALAPLRHNVLHAWVHHNYIGIHVPNDYEQAEYADVVRIAAALKEHGREKVE